MARLHLGINTCFAVKRWPEPQQWLSIVKEELGLDCCQFS
ncbi:MAG TPA: xylose isomerase, partial [Ktedonobacter sp.]|nr:xylose isomerase [Ktedonobacter sp.]